MQRYKNLGGNSGVRAFEIGPTSILVEFRGGTLYLYTGASAGQDNLETMKQLAQVGQGLNTFISQVVRKRYEAKLR